MKRRGREREGMINSKEIKERAKKLGIRQSDIANALGIKQSTACQKINNARPMSLEEAEILAELLRIEDEDFSVYFFGKVEPKGGDGQQSGPGCFGLNDGEMVQILYETVKNLSERLATKDRKGEDEMSLYTPIVKRYPKAKPLAMSLITAAAEQGASIEELRYACKLAMDACEKGRDISVPAISLFSSEAKAALERI